MFKLRLIPHFLLHEIREGTPCVFLTVLFDLAQRACRNDFFFRIFSHNAMNNVLLHNGRNPEEPDSTPPGDKIFDTEH